MLILELLLLAVAFVGGWWILRKIGVLEKVKDKRSEIRIDKLADTMVDPREVDETNVKHLAETTERLAPAIPRDHPGYLGIPLGETVVGKRDLRLPWEFVCLAYAGARMGKSAGLAIPAICHAPGATIVASNRGDVYSHTVGLRRKSGRVWLFDLQGVTTGDRRQRATFWFNPLRNVTDLPSAAAVCGYFISAATDANAKVDAYFDGNARDLFASYMLAASLAGGDIRHVVEWLTNTQSQIPPAILKQYGYPDLAKTMRGKQSVNAKQRDGFYDMARRFLAPLDEPRYAEAVLPNQRTIIGTDPDGNITFAPGDVVHDLPEFIAEEFVARTDTMYAMSKDGPGSSSAISSALVGQILNSAEEYSEQQESERMPIPMTAVLDEAANICKLEDLPRWYSISAAAASSSSPSCSLPRRARRSGDAKRSTRWSTPAASPGTAATSRTTHTSLVSSTPSARTTSSPSPGTGAPACSPLANRRCRAAGRRRASSKSVTSRRFEDPRHRHDRWQLTDPGPAKRSGVVPPSPTRSASRRRTASLATTLEQQGPAPRHVRPARHRRGRRSGTGAVVDTQPRSSSQTTRPTSA